MTLVNLKYRRIDGVNPEGVLITSGLVEVTPAYRSDTGSGQMTTISDTYPVGSTITLAGGTYLFKLRASDGKGGRLKDEGVYRLVPASGTFDVDDLTETNPTIGSVTQSDVAAMIAAAVEGLIVGPGGTPTGTGPGGAFYIQDVLDSTTVGRSLVKATDPAAGRTAIGAAAAANAVFTGTVSVPTDSLDITDTNGLTAALNAKAPLASPAFTGNPTAPTPTAGDNDTSVATTAFVTTALSGVTGGAPLASPAFTGTPTAPTALAGTSTTQIATTAFVTAVDVLKAPINDPTFTGSVTLPDPVDPTDAATKNYVDASMAAASPREGNVVAIFGATTARVHPSTGLALDPDTVVLWLTDGTAATNAINGDITLNRATI